MKKNQQALLDIMHKFRLKSPDVAKLLNCTPNTVRGWRCEVGNDIPTAKLELLTFKLKASNGTGA